MNPFFFSSCKVLLGPIPSIPHFLLPLLTPAHPHLPLSEHRLPELPHKSISGFPCITLSITRLYAVSMQSKKRENTQNDNNGNQHLQWKSTLHFIRGLLVQRYSGIRWEEHKIVFRHWFAAAILRAISLLHHVPQPSDPSNPRSHVQDSGS